MFNRFLKTTCVRSTSGRALLVEHPSKVRGNDRESPPSPPYVHRTTCVVKQVPLPFRSQRLGLVKTKAVKKNH